MVVKQTTWRSSMLLINYTTSGHLETHLYVCANSNPNPSPSPKPNANPIRFGKMTLRTSELLPIYDAE